MPAFSGIITTWLMPAGGKSGEHAQHDVGAVGDLKAAGVSDHPADVAGRNRIGNDTHDRTGHNSLPQRQLTPEQ